MNMIYNSALYCVVEFAAARGYIELDAAAADEAASEADAALDHEASFDDVAHGKSALIRGYEIMDKLSRREIYLNGELADGFRRRVTELIASEPSVEDIDEFLSGFSSLMQQPVVLH